MTTTMTSTKQREMLVKEYTNNKTKKSSSTINFHGEVSNLATSINIKTLRKNVFEKLKSLSTTGIVNFKTYAPLLEQFYEIEGSKKKLLKFQDELGRYTKENNTKGKVKEAKKTNPIVEPTLSTKFLLHVELLVEYNTKNGDLFPTRYKYTVVSGPYDKKGNKIIHLITKDVYPSMKVLLEEFSYQDSIKSIIVLNHRQEFMKYDPVKNTPKKQQLMKKEFVLKNEWLKHSKAIATYAYDHAEDECVDYQLQKFILDPPGGRKQEFIEVIHSPSNIKKYKIEEDGIFIFFANLNSDVERKSGRTVDMIESLCKALHRNMYAYDSDDKMFYNNTSNNENDHYCPIVFYIMNGHFYIINDKTAISSTVNSSKASSKINTTLMESETFEKKQMDVFHIEKYEVEQDYPSGVYLIKETNLDNEALKYMSYYSSVCKVITRENLVVQFKFKNANGEDVVMACDNNMKIYNQINSAELDETKHIKYDNIKRIADYNNIEFVNEGLGSLISKILDKKLNRRAFTQDERSHLIQLYNDVCCECSLKHEKYEIDHIKPLACGGTNEIDNLQILCEACHKKKTVDEQQLGIYKNTCETLSVFNKTVEELVFKTIYMKTWAFVEIENKEVPPTVLYPTKSYHKIDVRKCRKNIMYYSKYEFPVYSVMDIPKPFIGKLQMFQAVNGNKDIDNINMDEVERKYATMTGYPKKSVIQCGFYFINKNDVGFPFRGSGWYIEPLIQYGLDNGLIHEQDITLEFLPSTKLRPNHFQKSINMLTEAFSPEPKLLKMCHNSFIGLMGKTEDVKSNTKFTMSDEEASNLYADCENDVFIRNRELDNGEVMYQCITNKSVVNESTNYCIYAMILQLEAIELHKIETLVLQHDGYILDRNTDAIRYYGNKIDITNYYWDDAKTLPKYQDENSKPLQVERCSHFKRVNHVDVSKFTVNWNIEYDYEGYDGEDWKNCMTVKAKQIAESGKSYFIQGNAGVGKSYFINEIKRNIVKSLLAFSPTNKGARIIGGQTIHSLYYKFRHNKNIFKKLLQNVEYIFIDEVSMMPEIFYQLFNMIKRLFPNMVFLISGDFGQLAPVKDSWSGDYENSPAMNLLCSGNKLVLTKCRRADDKLFKLCQNVKSINMSDFAVIEPTLINLCYTHQTRIKVNTQLMNKYITDLKRQYITIPKDINDNKTQDVKLCVGMPVICNTTNMKLNILNSEQFTVSSIKDDEIHLKGENPVIIKVSDFNKFFYLGFCITIHSCQGATYNTKYTIHDWDMLSHFDECDKLKYVAMSRATDINNIQLC